MAGLVADRPVAHRKPSHEAVRQADRVGQTGEQSAAGREVRPSASATTFNRERDVVAFTRTVISLSWVCEPSQLALFQLRRSPSPLSGANVRCFVKDPG